ncbi:MAG: B-box zinc finger protein [Lentisphaeria bacterium]|nr:B-box zinc finger protein [Lentisphaeria bacterium]
MAGLSYCLNHPDTPAVTRCATCGKHICAECIVERDGAQYCSEQCAQAAANSAGRVDTAVAAGDRLAKKSRIRSIVILIIVIAAAAAAWYFYKNNKDDVNAFVQKQGQEAQKKMNSTKQSLQKSVPGDSKYKRDREGAVGK